MPSHGPHVERRLARPWVGLCLLLAGVVSGWHVQPLSAAAAGAREYGVKAAFVYNFTKFIEWPAECFDSSDSAFVIAVADSTPMLQELQKAVRGRKVAGREIVVTTYRPDGDSLPPHIVFVGAAEAHARDLLRKLEGRPILTVGETDNFLNQGGTIGFVFEGEKLRFAIDRERASRARLRISAQLLKLAQQVRRGDGS